MPPKTRATIHDVARAAGVSTKSISRVINGEPGVSQATRQRILDAIASLGYVANPAAQRLRGSAKVIGLIISGFEDYAREIVRGMSLAGHHLGYNLMLCIQHNELVGTKPYETLISGGLISGVLMIVPFGDELLFELCEKHQLPYVMVDYQKEPPDNIPIVTVTNRRGMLEATRYLLALGHREIGFITGAMSMASARERLQGYQDALADAQVAYDPALVVEGNWTQQAGFTQTQILLERHPTLTAIIASDDLTAFGVMDAVKESGRRVGEDISVIGFDDIPKASAVFPPLTTIRQPMPQMGEAAVELVVALMEGRTPMSLRREFATELIIRQSTGKPPERSGRA